MLTLLPIHLINPGTDRVMCVTMRKNCNYTDLVPEVTCVKCQDHYARNVEWWANKLSEEEFNG